MWVSAENPVLWIEAIVNQNSPDYFGNTWLGERFDSANTHMRFPWRSGGGGPPEGRWKGRLTRSFVAVEG